MWICEEKECNLRLISISLDDGNSIAGLAYFFYGRLLSSSLRGCRFFIITLSSGGRRSAKNIEIAFPLLSRQTSQIKDDGGKQQSQAILYSWISLDLENIGAEEESHENLNAAGTYGLLCSALLNWSSSSFIIVGCRCTNTLHFAFDFIPPHRHKMHSARPARQCTRTPFYFRCRAHRVVAWGILLWALNFR